MELGSKGTTYDDHLWSRGTWWLCTIQSAFLVSKLLATERIRTRSQAGSLGTSERARGFHLTCPPRCILFRLTLWRTGTSYATATEDKDLLGFQRRPRKIWGGGVRNSFVETRGIAGEVVRQRFGKVARILDDTRRGVSYGFLTVQGGRDAEIVVSPDSVVAAGMTPPGELGCRLARAELEQAKLLEVRSSCSTWNEPLVRSYLVLNAIRGGTISGSVLGAKAETQWFAPLKLMGASNKARTGTLV